MHACTHTSTFSFPCACIWGYFVQRRSSIKHMLTNILSCANVVRHNDKVQWVSSEEAITGLYTSSPVSLAFCLSADAVKPSIFSPSFTCLLSPAVPLLLWLLLYLSLIYCICSSAVHLPVLFNHQSCTLCEFVVCKVACVTMCYLQTDELFTAESYV